MAAGREGRKTDRGEQTEEGEIHKSLTVSLHQNRFTGSELCLQRAATIKQPFLYFKGVTLLKTFSLSSLLALFSVLDAR